MNYRIEEMGTFRVVGLVIHTTNESMEGYQKIPAFWGEVMQGNKQLEILNLMNHPPFGLIGVNAYNTDLEDARKFDYYIACSTDKSVPEGMAEYTVPASKWAVFLCKREEIGQVEARIVTEWLPTSGYELLNSGYETGDMKSGAPDLEVYGQDGHAEVWVAVKGK